MYARALIAVTLLAAAASPAHATPADDFDRASQLFRAHDWQSAIPLLGAVLYPNPLLGNASQVFEAHALLGACELETGDEQTAHDEFVQALNLDPDRTLPPDSFSKPVIDAFEATKIEIHARNADEAAAQRRAEANDKVQAYLNKIVIVQQHQFGLNFVPFGAGQYQNKQMLKFGLLFGGELLAGGTSIVIFAYLANKYGINGTVNPTLDDPHHVRILQQVEIGSGAVFYGLYVYGVVDAILHYRAATRVQTDPSLLPPDLRSIDPNAPSPSRPPPPPPKTSFHLGPILVPSGAGIGLAWEH